MKQFLVLFVLTISLLACSEDDAPTTEVMPLLNNNIDDRILQIENAIATLDGNRQSGGVIAIKGQFTHQFSELGYSFCMPTDPNAAPDLANANGTTNMYSCANNLNLTYEIVDAATIRLHVDIPTYFIDMSGNINSANFNGNYTGYITASNTIMSFNVVVIDNGDATFSLGNVTEAVIYASRPRGITYDSISLTTTNATLNSSLNGGLLGDTLYAHVTTPLIDVSQAITTTIESLDDFVF